MKINQIRSIFYVVAGLLILIPTVAIMLYDVSINDFYRSLFISSALILVILGKLIDVIEKRKQNKRISADIGILIGLALVLIVRNFL